MGPRYPGGPRPGVRMPQMGPEFGGVSVIEYSNGGGELICFIFICFVWE